MSIMTTWAKTSAAKRSLRIMKEQAEEYRANMIESHLGVRRRHHGSISGRRRDLREGHQSRDPQSRSLDVKIIPVTCGTSYRNKGVQKLLDAIVDYMPSPLDRQAIQGINPDTEEEDCRHPSDDEPFSALAFKIMTDPYVGKLCFFRVYSGTLDAGSTVSTIPQSGTVSASAASC